MIDPAESARLALYCMEAEAIGPVPMPPVTAQDGLSAAVLGPALPDWIAKDRSLLGWISGMDAYLEGFLNIAPHRVFYGWILDAEDGLTAVIRGTENMVEWAADAMFLPMIPHAAQGRVETGFWNLASTLEFRDLNGVDGPLLRGFASRPTMVTGHSLGAALAMYVTLELAEQLGRLVRGRFIASPRTGNAAFVDYFSSKVSDAAVYAYARDIVPKVPDGFGYSALPNLITLPANPLVPDNLLSNHHAGNYAFEIWPDSIKLLPEGERTFPR